MNSLTFIEVCAGAGGLSSGFIRAGFEPLLLNELDPICCQTLAQNHARAELAPCSMTELDLTAYRRRVDVLMGGVPCQAFSQAGKRQGLEDARGDLILEFKRLIDEVQPKIFLIENVKGLITHEKGATFARVLARLGEGGWTVQWKLLNAKDYGVPQKRERVFIVGRREAARDFSFPSPLGGAPAVLRDVLLDCPPSAGVSYPARKREILELVPPGGCWVNLPLEIQREYMGNSFHSGGGRRGIARRLSLDEPSLTLTTAPDQKQTERCHPLETRPFTVREYARIQTFPDDYEFKGTIRQQYKQIGNAVPVLLAYEMAKSIERALV
jgi:DNA (cytosine-5)-methyltransferase 1